MPAEQTLREGRLQEALDELKNEVRADPANARHRTFLFQLLAVRGEWNRALNQLNVAGELDPATLAMVQTYREALLCEALRAEVFAGNKTPLFLGEPPAWIARVMEALKLTAGGQHEQAQALREQAFENAETTAGSINDEPFEWIADADSRMGPLLEAVINGKYYWIPFENTREIHIEAPQDLRDVVWTPAYFTWGNGGQAAGLIPTRYPGSESSDDPKIALARSTEWDRPREDVFLGLGQRMWMTDAGEYALMDVRNVKLETTEAA